MIDISFSDPEIAVVRLLTCAFYFFAFYRVMYLTFQRWGPLTRFGKRLWIGYMPTLFTVVWFMFDAVEENLKLKPVAYGFLASGTILAAATYFRFTGDESSEPVYQFHLRERNPLKWRIQKLR